MLCWLTDVLVLWHKEYAVYHTKSNHQIRNMTIRNVNRRGVTHTDIWWLDPNLTKIRQRHADPVLTTHTSCARRIQGGQPELRCRGLLLEPCCCVDITIRKWSFSHTKPPLLHKDQNMNNWSRTRCKTQVCVTWCLLHVTQQSQECMNQTAWVKTYTGSWWGTGLKTRRLSTSIGDQHTALNGKYNH